MARIKPQALLLQSKKKKGTTRISVTTIILCNLVVVLFVLSLVATYRHWFARSSVAEDGLHTFEDIDISAEKKFDVPSYAILNTAKGMITVELNKEASPEVVDKFIDLCQKGHFKGMPFHYVIKHFVIQGGDIHGLGSAEDWIVKGKPDGAFAIRLLAQFDDLDGSFFSSLMIAKGCPCDGCSPKHEAFMLGTSKAKGDNKAFDLFITTAPIPDLNDKISVFGRVIKGEEVVQEIEEVDTDEHYRPKSPIGIISVTLKREL